MIERPCDINFLLEPSIRKLILEDHLVQLIADPSKSKKFYGTFPINVYIRIHGCIIYICFIGDKLIYLKPCWKTILIVDRFYILWFILIITNPSHYSYPSLYPYNAEDRTRCQQDMRYLCLHVVRLMQHPT